MNGFLTAGLILIGIVGAGFVIYHLLNRIILWGGNPDDEADAFRGSGSDDAPPLDATNRIVRPTQDGGAHVGF